MKTYLFIILFVFSRKYSIDNFKVDTTTEFRDKLLLTPLYNNEILEVIYNYY